MGQIGGIRRRRIGRAGFVAGAIGALVIGLTAPAWACNAIVAGSVDCSTGQRVVHWTIGNDQTTLPMTIVHALASIGAPPDAFSATGQNWGMPLYRWDVIARDRWLTI